MSVLKKHTMTVQVGNETVENAQYCSFDDEEQQRQQRDMSFRDKLDVLWWDITLPFRKIKSMFSDVYWEVRYGFERMFKGYDSVDTFEVFAKFTERYQKIITAYNKNRHSHPCTTSDKEWETIVDEMLYHLYYMDSENIEKELCKNMPENWWPSLSTVDDIMIRHKDAFFKLFSEHFYDLWD